MCMMCVCVFKTLLKNISGAIEYVFFISSFFPKFKMIKENIQSKIQLGFVKLLTINCSTVVSTKTSLSRVTRGYRQHVIQSY